MVDVWTGPRNVPPTRACVKNMRGDTAFQNPVRWPGRELVQIDGERVELSPQTAQTLGLALFELGCGGAARLNAEDAPRRFALDWRIEGDQFHLRWTEVDGEMEPRPPLNPFSALVLDQMTPAALYGSTAWESGEGQRAWALDCPLSKITVPVLD